MKYMEHWEKTGMFTETMPLSPNSPYSASKAGADLMVRIIMRRLDYLQTSQDAPIITDLTSFRKKLIPLMINNCKKTKTPPYMEMECKCVIGFM